MKKRMEELRPDWQIVQSIQSRAQFSNKARVESSINSNNKFQVFTQGFIKPDLPKYLSSRLQPIYSLTNYQDGC